MATLTTVPAQQPAASHRSWNTPEILSRSRMLLFALVALLVGTVVLATQTHRGAMTLVGVSTEPSVVKAQEIRSALADMDADAVNELLDSTDIQAVRGFESHRVEASKAVVEAAHNITFGKAESGPIETVEVVMGSYEREVQQAIDAKKDGDLKEELRLYHSAAGLMDGTLLPNADALDKANDSVLNDEYSARSKGSFTARVFVLLLGLALSIALVLVQLFLSRRMRRTLNPALLAATLLGVGFTFYSFTLLYSEQSELDLAKSSAYTSVHALLQARAVAYSANSDESRFLLDSPFSADSSTRDLQAFDSKVALLSKLPAHTTPDHELLRTGKPISGFSGLLADEYNNITLPGEKESAIESILALERYVGLDARLRGLESGGLHQQAIALCVGMKPDQSNGAFQQFDDALGRTLKINTDEFDRAVASGFSAISNLELEACVVGIVLAVLIFFGFAPRIREYQ